MLKIFVKTFLFAVLVCGICYAMAMYMNSIPGRRKPASRFYSPSRLMMMTDNTKYDLILLGRSQTENVTLGPNYDSTVNILNRKFFNLSKTGAGVLPLQVMLEYFRSRGNSGKTILYFIDSPILLFETYNEKHVFMESEPFDLKLLQLAVKHGIDPGTLEGAFQSKFRREWFRLNQDEEKQVKGRSMSLRSDDTSLVQAAVTESKAHKLDTVLINRYGKLAHELVKDAKAHNENIVFVIPPTLRGDLPSDKFLIDILESIKKEHGAPYYDLRFVMPEAQYFYDPIHLNPTGINIMLRQYIKPILDSVDASAQLPVQK